VIWVVERTSVPGGATAIQARVFTFVPEAAGWVEWLAAADPAADRWSDVNVLASDVTGDAVPELLVGFRGVDERSPLEYDVVGYSEDGLPLVLAHRDPLARAVLVVSAGTIQEYEALYPNDEPACCPPSYLRRTIGFDDGFFRISGTETISPNALPTTQL
jgi:hypothetical protein